MTEREPSERESTESKDETARRDSTPGFGSEPKAGEGSDEDEAVVTRGPAAGGASGKAGQGTTEEAG